MAHLQGGSAGADQRGGMHTNEKSHVKLITIGSSGPYKRGKGRI